MAKIYRSHVDVVGAGSGDHAAAISAARHGDVLLVEH